MLLAFCINTFLAHALQSFPANGRSGLRCDLDSELILPTTLGMPGSFALHELQWASLGFLLLNWRTTFPPGVLTLISRTECVLFFGSGIFPSDFSI